MKRVIILLVGIMTSGCNVARSDSENISPKYFDNVNGVICYTNGPALSCVKVN